MKFALFTGCVAKGATRELMLATIKSAEALGIDFVEMKSAACCGAGVISEKNPVLTDAINARTFALAEEQNLDLITICSTCQGNLKKSECHLDSDEEYKDKINHVLKMAVINIRAVRSRSNIFPIFWRRRRARRCSRKKSSGR